MTTLEHSFPFPVAYEDVSKLFAQSGTAYTPTYVVSYAGPWGEEYVWVNHDVPNDPKYVRRTSVLLGPLCSKVQLTG